jgi:hypothetical protein
MDDRMILASDFDVAALAYCRAVKLAGIGYSGCAGIKLLVCLSRWLNRANLVFRKVLTAFEGKPCVLIQERIAIRESERCKQLA